MTAKAPRSITTNQEGVHEDLLEVVERYKTAEYRKPIAEHTQVAFDAINEVVQGWQGDIILDSCCGVGESTLEIATRYPEALVIGVDKSEVRLNRIESYGEQKGVDTSRVYMVRADLNDFWRLAVNANWSLARHYLLYPNPYPKKKHLQRRWHASPSFPFLLRLGGVLEVRSNWKTYVDEFAAALQCYQVAAETKQYQPEGEYWTPFERKYHGTGQDIWFLTADLD
ncbi:MULTISPECIES: tRNA (guanosine(46)-N(7))-methyltransferase TrmB [Gammaproteobacteria]|uniref:tRNA (guanine(46)-N(7))-methyltransferase TrmB n=1 Tax=Gammaproteobacteria TaxID=1236 RepID=UPI000DCFE425|nr:MULTISPECIES: methyltransferase domain-containing protein [Gammaproteobacteria]RTE85648.1 methyltransferase domain-containing protein [Aliidiomarina sp. B3213]TCZ89617.1 methyltransferase domain-containing protein [Lysobacter sp. N42]